MSALLEVSDLNLYYGDAQALVAFPSKSPKAKSSPSSAQRRRQDIVDPRHRWHRAAA
jgi:hypothetical protein